MDWQQIAALLVVALSASLLVLSRLNRGKAEAGCGGDCGCTDTVEISGRRPTRRR